MIFTVLDFVAVTLGEKWQAFFTSDPNNKRTVG